MAVSIIQNAAILAGKERISGGTNKVAVDYGINALMSNVMGLDTDRNIAGTFKASIAAEGVIESDLTVHDIQGNVAWGSTPTYVGANNSLMPLTVLKANGDNELGYSMNSALIAYNETKNHGEQHTFVLNAEPSSKFVRGTNITFGSKVATGSGTARQLGAVIAGQYVYAALHVVKYVGAGSLTMRLQSDNAVGFPSQATVITFNAVTAQAAQWAEIAGPFTDDWWRADWTFTGTSFEAYLLVAIATPRRIS